MAQDTDNRREDQIYDINSTFVTGGLQTDVSEVNQPQGTQRYVLNGIRETVNKDINTLSNDYSNEQLNTSDVPLNNTTNQRDYLLGSIYLNDDEFVLFILTYVLEEGEVTNQISKLCLFNSVTKTMQLLISDENSEEEDKLHFNEHHQIQGIYRLRRGCDRTIYFTDNFNAPRTINIDKLYNYYGVNETYAISTKFNLIRTYNKIPEFKKYIGKDQDDEPIYEIGVKVKEGGKLLPGGYNLTIRLLDDDLNTTDWITTTDVVVISNFSDNEYTKMKGSTARVTDWQNFGNTDKLIEVSVLGSSIDTNFKFLQFGLIYANSGDGTVGGVYVSPMIGIEEENTPDNYTYQFTGAVEYDKDTAESVSFGPINVGKAKTITSSQNRLLLGNVESKQVDWCKLQKYASKIAVCAEKKTINLKETENNIANAIHNLEDNGYMPGEIYSFGIVYVFDDGTTSPAYHIPGLDTASLPQPQPPRYHQSGLIDSNGAGDYVSMRGDNVCKNISYLDKNGCEDSDYWGKDYFGNDLINQKVRHHRFPTRTEIGEPLYQVNRIYEECNLKECDAGEKTTECRNEYYLDIPYHRVTNHYKLNHSSFDIEIYIGIYNPNGNETMYVDNNIVNCDVEIIKKTIDIDDWEASQKGTDNNEKNKVYRINLGIYDYPPNLIGISETPVKYVRSDGDKGTRFGWETTAGWQKIKYKTQDNSWEEDPDTTIPGQGTISQNRYVLTEDGDNLRLLFFGVNTEGEPVGNSSHTANLKGYCHLKKAKFQFATTLSILTYIGKHPEIEYYNVSVVNIKELNGKDTPVRNIRSKRDIQIECKNVINDYSVSILGAHFWNISIPSLKDTNGNKVIGYYIVRNKRDEDNKTVLDSAITFPLCQELKSGNVLSKYITYGFTDANNADGHQNISKSAIGFISPEFKYLKKKYKNFTFVTQGTVSPIDVKDIIGKYCKCGGSRSIVSTCSYINEYVSSFDTDMIMDDVQPGTSYNKKENRKTEKDNDGYELHSLIRERIYQYQNRNALYCHPTKVKYLDALDDSIMDTTNGLFAIHNLSSDNAIGIMELDDDSLTYNDGTALIESDKNLFYNNMMYGYLKVPVENPYGNFRLMPYYRESKNLEPIGYDENEPFTSTTVFSGDVYTTPMKYWNSVYYNTRLRLRRRKPSLWMIVTGAVATAVSVVGGAFASIYTGGAALQVSVAAVKASFSLMMSGVKMAKMNTLYAKLYFKGLQVTLEDTWTKWYLKNPNPADDQIQWVFEIANSLWFESTVNQFWRVGTSGDLPDFLEPLKLYDTQDYVSYITNKMTVADNNQNNGRLYQGFAAAEYYEVNPDYMRGNTQKIFYHLPIQYDCCSKCLERYPHRVMYSEVSFQEELTDNYTTFLANNYRDIPGETGEITNLFQQDTFLYIQTEEGLWNMPVGTQEIKTQGLTTYLGNGAFFSNEPQRISDAGLGSKYQHGTLITKDGIFFIDEQYGKVYLLQKGKTAYGKSTLGTPIPIIDLGMSYWGKDNVRSFTDEEYRKEHGGLHYPHLDNPASEGGMGYLSVYDEKNERFILTKKDKVVRPYYLDDNDEKVYPTFIEFNGEYYDTAFEDLETPDENEWELIKIQDNKAIWGRFYCHPATSGEWGVVEITPSDSGTQTITDKIIKFVFQDENGNVLSDTQIQNFGLSLDNIVIQYTIDGVPHTSTQYLLVQNREHTFDNNRIDGNSTIAVTNIDSIVNHVFENANQTLLNTQSVSYTVDTLISCDFSFVVTVTVTTTSSDECYLSVKKVFQFQEGEELPDIDTLYGYFKSGDQQPEINILGTDIPLTIEGFGYEANRAVFDFGLIKVECFGDGAIDWEQLNPDNPDPQIDESGLWEDPATVAAVYEMSGWTFLNGNTKYLTLINEPIEEEVYDENPGEAKSNTREIKQLREIEPVPQCVPASDYDQQTMSFEANDCEYRIESTQLRKLTVDPTETIDNSWTVSFNMKTMSWQSFHSYLPNFYIGAKDIFYSFKLDEEGLWKHNVEGNFGTYYDKHYDFIVDFVSVSENGIATKVWNDIYVTADVKRYDDTLKDYYDINDVFFNKAIVWNHRQCSKELELLLKENQQDENYLYNQIINEDGKITVDRNERNWAFNGFRDNVNHNQKQPMWVKKYDGDVKGLNTDIFDFGNNILQNWYETEIFRGKFLEVMLKFTNFAVVNESNVDDTNVKIIMYFTIEGRNKTVR